MTGVKLLRVSLGSALALVLMAPTAALADRRSESEAAFQRGFDRFEKGDVRTARIEAMKALQANPSNPLARILNARVMLEIGNGVAAQTEIEKAVAAGFPRDKTRHLLAHALLLQNQLPRALKEADPANVPDQFASYAARMRGRAQVSQQQPERARAEFELAARLAPNSAEALIDLARFRMINQDPGGGVAEVDRALQIEPTNIKGLLLKGDMVRASQGLEKSLPFFNQALQVDPNNIEALLERAGTYGDLRREKESRADLQKVLGLVPDHPLALYLSAVLESRAGRYAQAQALMTRTKGILNTYAPALMLQGMLAYQTGNMQQADEFLAKVVAQVPGSSLARKLYAAVQLRKGDAEGALATLKPVIDAGKPDARTLALVGSAHARLGNYAEAQRFLERASAGAPNETDLKTQLAMTKIAQGDDAGANAMLQQVLKSDKNSLQALMTLTLVNLRTAKYREALAAANQIVTAYPQLPIGFNMRGAAMLGLGDIKAAEANFRTALAKKPDFAEARRNLAQLLAATNRVPAARKELLTILETNRNDVRAMSELAEIARRQGQTTERINWLRQAAAVNPQGVQPRISLAQAYVQSGQTEKALTEVSALERDFPQNPAVVELAGVTQLASRRTAQAESAFNRLVTLAPNQVGPRILLARAQALQNRTAEARATYQQALTLTGQNLVPVYVDMIALESRANNMPGAMALVQRLRAAYPKLNVADQVTGDLQLNAGNFPAAIAAYQAARRVQFDRSVALRLSAAYLRAGQPQNALVTLQAFQKVAPRDQAAAAGIADIYVQQRNYKAAIAVYERLRAQGAGRDPAVANNLAWSYHSVGDKRAVGMANLALRLAPSNPAIMDTAGKILVETKTDPKRGLQLLQRAAKASPRDPNIRYNLAVAFNANGMKADAIRELNLALQAPRFDSRAQAARLLQQLRS